MATFFTSDIHHGHRKVAFLRGYGTEEEPDVIGHDGDLAEAWDSIVGKDDVVWVLGDISAGGAGSQRMALNWVKERRGTKHLIAGNHDGCHPMHRDSHKWQREYLDAFDSVQMAAQRRIPYMHNVNGVRVAFHQTVLMSHFPYSGEGDRPGDDRFPEWRLRDEGTPVLHGHVHTKNRLTRSNRGTLQIHIGVDAWGRPVSLEELSSLLEKGDHLRRCRLDA